MFLQSLNELEVISKRIAENSNFRDKTDLLHNRIVRTPTIFELTAVNYFLEYNKQNKDKNASAAVAAARRMSLFPGDRRQSLFPLLNSSGAPPVKTRTSGQKRQLELSPIDQMERIIDECDLQDHPLICEVTKELRMQHTSIVNSISNFSKKRQKYSQEQESKNEKINNEQLNQIESESKSLDVLLETRRKTFHEIQDEIAQRNKNASQELTKAEESEKLMQRWSKADPTPFEREAQTLRISIAMATQEDEDCSAALTCLKQQQSAKVTEQDEQDNSELSRLKQQVVTLQENLKLKHKELSNSKTFSDISSRIDELKGIISNGLEGIKAVDPAEFLLRRAFLKLLKHGAEKGNFLALALQILESSGGEMMLKELKEVMEAKADKNAPNEDVTARVLQGIYALVGANLIKIDRSQPENTVISLI